jgi:hypothetical protein
VDQWYELIARGLYMEDLVVQQRAAMDAYDPSRSRPDCGRVGTWHPVEPGTNRAFLFQQNSLRDALVAATSLDIFNRHADKVVMTNIAQTINVAGDDPQRRAKRCDDAHRHVYEMYAAAPGRHGAAHRHRNPTRRRTRRPARSSRWRLCPQRVAQGEDAVPHAD